MAVGPNEAKEKGLAVSPVTQTQPGGMTADGSSYAAQDLTAEEKKKKSTEQLISEDALLS